MPFDDDDDKDEDGRDEGHHNANPLESFLANLFGGGGVLLPQRFTRFAATLSTQQITCRDEQRDSADTQHRTQHCPSL